MKTEIGEYIVGAYLKERVGCDFVGYNIRPPESGLAGLGELDVVGLEFTAQAAYLCEVTTHLEGLNYGGYSESIKRVKGKYLRQRSYAKKHLKSFKSVEFMFWSPVVPKGITQELEKIKGLTLVINGEYKRRVNELRDLTRDTTRDLGNPFLRTLQILEHLRDD